MRKAEVFVYNNVTLFSAPVTNSHIVRTITLIYVVWSLINVYIKFAIRTLFQNNPFLAVIRNRTDKMYTQ